MVNKTYFEQEARSVLSYIQDCDSPVVHRMMVLLHYLQEQEWQLKARSGVHLVAPLVLE